MPLISIPRGQTANKATGGLTVGLSGAGWLVAPAFGRGLSGAGLLAGAAGRLVEIGRGAVVTGVTGWGGGFGALARSGSTGGDGGFAGGSAGGDGCRAGSTGFGGADQRGPCRGPWGGSTCRGCLAGASAGRLGGRTGGFGAAATWPPGPAWPAEADCGAPPSPPQHHRPSNSRPAVTLAATPPATNRVVLLRRHELGCCWEWVGYFHRIFGRRRAGLATGLLRLAGLRGCRLTGAVGKGAAGAAGSSLGAGSATGAAAGWELIPSRSTP